MKTCPLLEDQHLKEGSLALDCPPPESKDTRSRSYVHTVIADLPTSTEALGKQLQQALTLNDIPSYIPCGERLAILDSDGASLTYNQLHEWLNSLDKTALPLGADGCRVALCAANGPHLAAALVAVSSWCCCAPMDPNSVEAEFERDFKFLHCTAVIVDREDAPAHLAAQNLQLPCALMVPQRAAGTFTFKSLSGHSEEAFPRLQPKLSGLTDNILVLCTSGTTGNKKVVPYTMETIVVGASCIVKSWDLTEKDRCLNMMPLMHVGGILRNLLAVLFAEGSVICCPAFDQELFWQCLVALDATWYYASPTMHRAILEEAKIRLAKGLPMAHSLRMICNAAGGLPAKVAKELRETFECAVLPSYGMTECMPITSPPSDFAEDAPTTSGLPCGPEIQIVDQETGKPLLPNQNGHIVVRGPPVMGGYENNTEATRESFWPPGGWFATGDLGYLNKEGWLFVTGRAKEVIKRGGETVSPAEIEEAIVKHPDLKEVAAFAIGDVMLEENVALAVVMKDPDCRFGLPSLQDYLKSDLRPSCWPQALLFVEALPKTSTGKVRRAWLSKACAANKISQDSPWRERLFEARTTGCASADAIKVSKVAVSIEHTTEAVGELLGHDRCATVRLTKGKQSLVTYTTSPHVEVDEVKLATLSLHEYERPDAVVQVETLSQPWPEPKYSDYLNAAAYVAPRTEEEIEICKIWSSILGCAENAISAEADFFQLGGTSLLCGRVAGNIRAYFHCSMTMQVVYNKPKLSDLAMAVKEARDAESLSGTSTMGSTPNDSDAEDEMPASKSNYWNYSNTNPVFAFVQLIPFFLFPTVFHMSRFLIFLGFYHYLRSNNILQPIAKLISEYLFAHVLPEFLICWYVAMCLMPIVVSIILPLFGISCKWLLLGRIKPGRYPMWGGMHLRWWLMKRVGQFCRPGIFEQSDALYRWYLRLLGAEIHQDALIAPRISDHFFEGDLLTVHANAVLGEAHIACSVIEHGHLVFGKVTVQEGCSIGAGTILAKGTNLPRGTCLGLSSSSHEHKQDNDESMRRFNYMGFLKPSKFLLYCVGLPLVGIVHLISNIPYLVVVYYMVHWRPGSLTWSSETDHWLRQAIYALTYPERMVLWCVAICVHNVVCPIIHAGLLIFVKRFIVGKFVARERTDETDWDKLKIWIIRRLASQKFMLHFARLVGAHWQCMTWFYRAMGMRCGERIFWPGTPLDLTQFDLVEIGNDVVFGSRTTVMNEDMYGHYPIKVMDGAMVADRCQILPGVTLGKNAMLGSGSIGHKDASFPNNSIWVGQQKNKPVQLSDGQRVENGDSTVKPFGEAYAEGKTTYCLLPWPVITAFCMFCQAVTCWWQPPHGWVSFLVIVKLGIQWDYGWEVCLYSFIAYFVVFATIQILSLMLDILSKWLIIGRRKAGIYNWTDSSYNQRWKMHLVVQHSLHRTTHKEPYLELLGGSYWMCLYFRCMGATIGRNVSLYHNGGWPMMTEPDLVTIGDGASIGFCSLICHSNAQGNFEMNQISVGDYCTLHDRTRLAGGGTMESGSSLLEHTLVMPGEAVGAGTYWQGWPAHKQGPSKTWV